MAMKSGHYDMEDGHGYEPHYQQGMTKGMYTYCYINGDEFNVPKKILVNPKRDRTFNAFLDYATRVLNPRFGAVRNIYTPEGRHRIRRFEDMRSDGQYVACGQEPYKKLERPYTQIPTDSAKRQRHRNHYRNRSEDRIVPARHNKTFENIQPKYNTVNTQSCKISVFLNREYEKPPLKVTLDPHQQSSLDEMKKALRKKCEESFFRFHKLYTLDGRPVDDVRQIEPDGYYVAVDQYSKFEHGEYAPHGIKPLSVPLSPRYKFTETKYLWKDKSSLNGPVNGRHRSSLYGGADKRPRTLPPIESKKHSPDHSVSSYPETRKRNQVNGVPVKAAKHTKRTPGKQADYDKDDGGVFKAKGQNKDTRGAREVRDTGDTKVDLPIDQVRAEEVKEEIGSDDEKEAKVPSGVELSRQPSEVSETQDEKIRKEKQNKETNNRQKQADTKTSQQNGERSQGVKGDTKATANSQGVKGDTKASTNNSQNSTFKSNSKAPPQQASNNSVKNDTKKDAPPKQDDRNFNNNDPMRASTPNDAGKKSPAKDNKAPSPSDEHKAATKIQANYRGHQARKEVNDLKQKKQVDDQKKQDDAAKSKQLKQENEAATKIQAGFRGHQARKEVQAKKQVRDDKNSKEEAAATKIQSGYRGHRAREEIKQKKTQRTEKNTEEEAAAIKIQAGFRGHKARQDIKEKKQRRKDLQKEEEKAATKIQAGFRGHQARKEVQVKKQQRSQQEEEEKAATKIQAGFRGHQARKEVAKKKVYSCINQSQLFNNKTVNKSDLASPFNTPNSDNSTSVETKTEMCKPSTDVLSRVPFSECESSNTSMLAKSMKSRGGTSISLNSSHVMKTISEVKSEEFNGKTLESGDCRQGDEGSGRKDGVIGQGGSNQIPENALLRSGDENGETLVSSQINDFMQERVASGQSECGERGSIVNKAPQNVYDERDDNLPGRPIDGRSVDSGIDNLSSFIKMGSKSTMLTRSDSCREMEENEKSSELTHDNQFKTDKSDVSHKIVEFDIQPGQNEFKNENEISCEFNKETNLNTNSDTESKNLCEGKMHQEEAVQTTASILKKSHTFVSGEKKRLSISFPYVLESLNTLNVETIKMSLKRSKTLGKLNDAKRLSFDASVFTSPRQLKTLDVRSLSAETFKEVDQDLDQIDTSRSKSVEDKANYDTPFAGFMVKNKTFPEMVESDFEKIFPILMARSKRHKSFPYIDFNKTSSLQRSGSGLRSATDSQASFHSDDEFLDRHLLARSPGDGDSLTVAFDQIHGEGVRGDSRCGRFSNLGLVGSEGESESFTTESVLKTSRTGTCSLDDTHEIEWKKHDSSILNEIEDEAIELELLKMRHLATIYLQASVKSYLSRFWCSLKIRLKANMNEVTNLQAAVRGMIFRKRLEFHTLDDDIEVQEICRADAALRIQAMFRGYLVRKQNKVKRPSVKKQVTFGAVSRIEIVNGEFKKDITLIGKEIEDEDKPSLCKEVLKEGFTPKEGLLSPESNVQDVAARSIQAAFRLYRGKMSSKAVTNMQAAVHAFIDRQRGIGMFKEKINSGEILCQNRSENVVTENDKHKAALTIQRGYKSYIEHKFQRVKEEEMRKSVQTIQRAFRSWKYCKMKNIVNSNTQVESVNFMTPQSQKQQREKAAFVIQTMFRNYRKRQENFKHSLENDAKGMVDLILKCSYSSYSWQVDHENKERHDAALKVQSYYRGYRSRVKINHMKRELDKQSQSAVKIQSCYRGYRSRVKYRELKSKSEIERTNAAVKIQSMFRGYSSRKETNVLKERLQREKIDSVVIIQSYFRGYKARDFRRVECSSVLQAAVRGKLSRQQIRKDENFILKSCIVSPSRHHSVVKDFFLNPKQKTKLVEMDMKTAITKIQAAIRARKARAKHKRQLREVNDESVRYMVSALEGVLSARSVKDTDVKQSTDDMKEDVFCGPSKINDRLCLPIFKPDNVNPLSSENDIVRSSCESGFVSDRSISTDTVSVNRLDVTGSSGFSSVNIDDDLAVGGDNLHKENQGLLNEFYVEVEKPNFNTEGGGLIESITIVENEAPMLSSRSENKTSRSLSKSSDKLYSIEEESEFPLTEPKCFVVVECSVDSTPNQISDELGPFECKTNGSNHFDELSGNKEVSQNHFISITMKNNSEVNEAKTEESLDLDNSSQKNDLESVEIVAKPVRKSHAAFKAFKLIKTISSCQADCINPFGINKESDSKCLQVYLRSHLQASVRGFLFREGLVNYFTLSPVSKPLHSKLSWYVSKLYTIKGCGDRNGLGSQINSNSFTEFQSKRLDGKTDAVTLIQAVARGFLVRRRIQKRENTKQLLHLRSVAQEEVMDILGLIHERDKAATKIQSRYRGYRDRKKVNRIKVNEQRAEALLFLQANVRAFLARKDINKRLVMDFWRQDNPVNRLGYVDSIDKVQAAFHGYLFRKLAFVKLHQMLKRSKAVNFLQACFRAYIERWHMQRRQATNLARYHKAASDLQTGFQGFLTRRYISAGMSKRNNSATKIQTGVRGYFARKSFLQQKHAVTRIQSGYRGFKAKQQYEALAYERKNSAATKIQSHFRGYNIRKNVQLQARQLALELLLSGIRGYILRKEMTAKLISENQKYEAAVKIQSQFRCYSQKNKYETLKIHHRNEVWLNRSKAATRVQAHFRGYLSRKRLSTKTSDNTAVENEPIFVQGTTVNFDVMTSRNTMPRHAGRRQATMSNVSREQTYVINGEYHDDDHQTLASSPRSSRAYVDSFSLLQESFRSLLSRRKKSTKLSQSFFRDRTRFIAASHLQASIKAYMTRSVIRRLCQLENAPIAETSSLNHPTPPPFLKNPNEIKNSGSFEEQIGTTVDSILPAFMEETAASNHYHQLNEVKHDDEIAEEKVQYVIRNKSADRNRENQTPVQYLYRSRESTKYKTPVQTHRSPNQDDEQSLIERNDRIHRFEEPSPPIRSARSPTRHLFDKRIDEISPDIKLRRYEEPSPLKEPDEELRTENSPNDEYKDGNRLFEDPSSHNHSNFQIDLPSVLDSNIREDMDTHRSRFEEPSPVSSDPMNMDIEYPTSSRDKTDDLPSSQQIRKHSDATRNSHDSELSIETFSRRIVNEIQNNAILKEESLLILQAAFRGFLLRNKAYSKRLQKISKMDTDDKSIFDETTATFLHAGVKGFLSRHRELASPPEM